jgi:hypothetical protein
LLRAFLIVSAAILAVGAVSLSSRLSSDLHAAVLKDTGRDVNAYASTPPLRRLSFAATASR